MKYTTRVHRFQNVHKFSKIKSCGNLSGGFSLRCGTPRTLRKHAEVGQGPCKVCRGHCKACPGRCKACRGRPRTLPSMPRSCKASLHILGSHKSVLENMSKNFEIFFFFFQRLCCFIFSKDFENFQYEISLKTQTHTLYQ